MSLHMKSKTFKLQDWEKVSIQEREPMNIPDVVIDDIPGITQEQYKTWLEVRKTSGSGWSKMLIFTRLSTVWTGTQDFTWFWFKPTWYHILAVRQWITSNWNHCYSDWWYDGSIEWYMQIADKYSRYLTWGVLRVFYTNQWGWSTKATHSNFISDGITLNFTHSDEDIALFITAYS